MAGSQRDSVFGAASAVQRGQHRLPLLGGLGIPALGVQIFGLLQAQSQGVAPIRPENARGDVHPLLALLLSLGIFFLVPQNDRQCVDGFLRFVVLRTEYPGQNWQQGAQFALGCGGTVQLPLGGGHGHADAQRLFPLGTKRVLAEIQQLTLRPPGFLMFSQPVEDFGMHPAGLQGLGIFRAQHLGFDGDQAAAKLFRGRVVALRSQDKGQGGEADKSLPLLRAEDFRGHRQQLPQLRLGLPRDPELFADNLRQEDAGAEGFRGLRAERPATRGHEHLCGLCRFIKAAQFLQRIDGIHGFRADVRHILRMKRTGTEGGKEHGNGERLIHHMVAGP